MSDVTFHEDRLISALSKHWSPLTEHKYWHEMDIPMVNNAVSIAGFPKEVLDWIWEKKRAAFEIWS